MIAEYYFKRVIEDLFPSYLCQLGAEQSRSTPLLVRFEAARWFVELFALDRDAPRYSPHLSIGPLPVLSADPRGSMIHLTYIIPPSSPMRGFSLAWQYRDEEEMRSVFTRVRDDVFKPYAVPMLDDYELLVRMVGENASNLNQKWREERAGQYALTCREHANQAYARGDYSEYARWMTLIPEINLSKVERKKIAYAVRMAR